MLLDLYFKIILPGVTYALPIWGGHSNKDGFKSLESLHCRAARIIFNFSLDMPSAEALNKAKWDCDHRREFSIRETFNILSP